MSSRTISLVISALLLGWLSVLDGRFLHWFVVPLLACGTIIGADAVDWLRGRLSVMDPIGILGILGYHFFFVAPLLHVLWDQWMPYVIPPPDWRPWLGAMAILNFIGLLLYQFFRGTYHDASPWTARQRWTLDMRRFGWFLTFGLVGSGLLQLWIYVQYGGISGFVDAYLESERNYGSVESDVAFVNTGWLFTISESFPLLAMIGFAVFARKHAWARRWTVILAGLVVLLVLQIFFGGLRGSRSNTIWALFWAVGIIHFCIRPVSKNFIYQGIAFLAIFMYLFGFYKEAGLDAIQALKSSESRAQLERRTGRTWTTAILSDFARSDVQAFALYATTSGNTGYEYALGGTYLGAVALLIPRTVWPERPDTKMKWTTELESGPGTFSPGIWQSSRVYGLAGEAVLNFGPAAVPLSFLLLAAVVRWVRRFVFSLECDDSRFLLAPLFILACVVALINDSDVNLFFAVKYGALPFLLIATSSTTRGPATQRSTFLHQVAVQQPAKTV